MAERSGLPFEKRLEVMGVMWEVGEWFMVQVARDYEPALLADAERRKVEKRDFLTRLVQGTLEAADEERLAGHLVLPRGLEYQVVLGREISPIAWVAEIEDAFSGTLAPALAGAVEGCLVGVLPAHEGVDAAISRVGERQELRGGVLALGCPVRIGNLAESLEEARTVLVSLEPGSAGCFDVRSRGWRLAVACTPWLGDVIEQGLLAPLRENR
ncbi:hypothetical protein E4U03_04540 [Rothia nasimurium]|uniref:Uncharacterized protein n=1 Tax=Rothia nasimurium TaxID=85336 RepID=A0A4Y9F4E8_9MICC|nr:hypothetical protein [Rothia nasimurium]MBF0807886.1 hypothetical protein [Rothia nasimurium]TFU22890.1 hypothetical protein E4U03_04540 [Rothia nasimurium]